MRININISDDLLKQIDEKAKALFVSRSAYITLALVQKMQNDSVLDTMPSLVKMAQQAQNGDVSYISSEQLSIDDYR